MTRSISAIFVVLVFINARVSVRADETEAMAIVEKAIVAIGGEDKLVKARVLTWKSKGAATFDRSEVQISAVTTVEGLDRFRSEYEAQAGQLKVTSTTIVNRDKGWRRLGDIRTEMDAESLGDEKRGIYLAVVAATLIPLKGRGVKVDSIGEENFGTKPAIGIKVTPLDGRDFTLFFDKETSLPVKLVSAREKFRNQEIVSEITFADYKVLSGITKATKIEHKLGDKMSLLEEITDFRILESVPETFPETD